MLTNDHDFINRLRRVLVGTVLMAVFGVSGVHAQGIASGDRHRLCIPLSGPGQASVLVGRFRAFIEDEDGANLESALASGMYSMLQTRAGIVVSRLQRGESSLLLEEIFTGGARTDTRTAQAGGLLLSAGCQFLFGGQITRRGDTSVLTPYLLHAGTGVVTRPFPAISFQKQDILTRVGERLALSLDDYLRSDLGMLQHAAPAIATLRLEFACPQLESASGTSVLQDQVALMRDSLARRWSRFSAFEVGKSFSSSEPCAIAATAGQSNVYVLAIGGRLREAGGTTFAPELLMHTGRVGEPIAIRLPAVLADSLPSQLLATRFTESVTNFLDSITDGNWRITFDLGATDLAGQDLLRFVERRVSEGKPEAAAFSGYRAFTQNENDPLAAYALGKALLAKDRAPLALFYLLRTRAVVSPMPSDFRAAYYEQLGLAFAGTSPVRMEEARDALTIAFAAYGESARPVDASRVARTLASVYFDSGSIQRAKEAVLMQSEWRLDVESLLLLAKLEAAEERYDAADNWLRRASRMPVRDIATRVDLAQFNRALGARFFEERAYAKAAQKYRASLEFDDVPLGRFGLARALAWDGKYGDAIAEYERILFGTGKQRTFLGTFEGAWMNLIELYLITDDRRLEARVAEADRVLEGTKPRLVTAYLGVVGRLARGAHTDPEQDPAYLALRADLKKMGPVDTDWDNSWVTEFARRNLASKPNSLTVFNSLTKDLFKPKEPVPARPARREQ